MPATRFALTAIAPLILLGACNGTPTDETEATATVAPDAAQPPAPPMETTSPATTAPDIAQPIPTATETTSPAATPSDAAKPSPAPTAVAASPAVSAPPPAPTAKPPVAFMQCRTCHSIEPGKTGIGPSLAGIMGKKAGSVAGYNFSAPLKASGIMWTRATLDQWLQGPMKMVPGTKMVTSVPNAEARKAIIDYLETVK